MEANFKHRLVQSACLPVLGKNFARWWPPYLPASACHVAGSYWLADLGRGLPCSEGLRDDMGKNEQGATPGVSARLRVLFLG